MEIFLAFSFSLNELTRKKEKIVKRKNKMKFIAFFHEELILIYPTNIPFLKYLHKIKRKKA